MAYDRAIDLLRTAGAPVEVARTQVGLVDALMYLGSYDQALAAARDAASVLQAAGDLLTAAKLEMNVGNIYFHLDDPVRALRHYRRARRAFETLQDETHLAAAEANVGNALTQLDRFGTALRYLERAQRRYRRLGQEHMVATLDLNIGYVWSCRGSHLNALKHLHRARRVFEEAEARADTALADLDMAQSYLALQMLPETAEIATEAARLFGQEAMPRERAQALVFAAQALAETAPGQVEPLLTEARAIFQAQGNTVWPALIDLLLADLSASPDDALRLATSARATFQSLGLTRRRAHSALTLARAHERLGETEQSRALVHEAHDTANRLGLEELSFRSLHALARLDHSLPLYREAAKRVERVRRSLGTRSLTMSFARAVADVYEEMAELLVQDGAPLADVYDAFESARARSLVDEAVRPRAQRRDPGATDIDRMREQVRAMQVRLRTAELAERSEEAAELQQQLVPIERAFLARLDAEAIAHASPGAPPSVPIALPEVQEVLGDGVLLEYFALRDSIIALRITQHSADLVENLTTMSEIDGIAAKLRFLLNRCSRMDEDAARQAAALAATRGYLQQLHDLLIRPLNLPPDGPLVIAPYGALHDIPFHATHDGRAYLGEEREITVTPSASLLVRRIRPPAGNGSLVMGRADDYAPLIEAEIRDIAAMLDTHPYSGAETRRDVFIREAPDARYIHLAAHATVRADNPRFSAIHFADGPIAIHDLDGLHLQCELAVLSACATAEGTRMRGDEATSLARAFLGAGARRVIVSLWPVWDSTTRTLMTSLYRHLGAGMSPADALRQAQAGLRATHPHPYYWAPFILVA